MADDPAYRRAPRLYFLGGARRARAEMDEEIDSHLAMRIDDLVRSGLSPQDARAEAARRFGEGELTSVRRRLRAAATERQAMLQRRDRLGALAADVRFALRQAMRGPGFTALALATFALGIGLTTATFTLVSGVLLRALPFPAADRLVAIAGRDSLRNIVPVVSSDDWRDWKERARTLDALAIHAPRSLGVIGDGEPTRVPGELTSGNFFEVTRSQFVTGRPFTEDEARVNAPVAVISERLWRSLLGASPRLDRPLRVEGSPFTVIGVVASGSDYPAGTDLWMAVHPQRVGGRARNNVNWFAIGRLSPGASIEQATRDLDDISRRIRSEDPGGLYNYGVEVRPLRSLVVGSAVTYLPLLLGAVGFVLLIACANLAASNLARGIARGRELAVREALGAGRGRLVQQLLVEQLVLAVVGGVLGVFLAWGLVRWLVASWASEIPRAQEIRLDPAVLGFALGVSLLAGMLAGVAPALRVSRASLYRLMATGSRGAVRGGRNLPGRTLIAAEIALALALLAGAGLLIRSFRTLLERDLGFDTGVVAAEVTLPGARYGGDGGRTIAYWDALEASLRTIPGATAVGLANWIPLGTGGAGFIEVEGRDDPGAGAGYRVVSEDYFTALGIPLVLGRVFGPTDAATSPRVTIVNRRMADVYWPGESPVGKRLRASSQEPGGGGAPAPWLTVVGVVGDVRHWGLESEARPEMFVLHRQVPDRTLAMTAVVRGDPERPPAELAPAVRRRILALDPLIAPDVTTLEARADRMLANRRFTMLLLTGFAGFAVVLAALGLYATLSYAVSRRTRELAVRSALGARRGQLVRLVARGALGVVAAGSTAGLASAWSISKAMAALLVDISPVDPMSYLAASVVLLGVCLVAIVIPALRATRVDPAAVLQAE